MLVEPRFNPRPRAAGDASASASVAGCVVSIHARARRATNPIPAPDQVDRFQSTPARGGRRLPRRGFLEMRCFNPRPRAAGDGAALNSFANKVQGDLNRGSAAAAAGDTVLLATTILYVLVKERLRIFANLAVACGALQVRDAYRTSV